MLNSSVQERILTTGQVTSAFARKLQATSSSILGIWIARSRQRKALGDLAVLNDYLLRDIGVTREEAFREAAKPFWRR
jgi:uncharacterized protein YjiS (DUF1127 family)